MSAYCKTIDRADYETSDLFTHVDNMAHILSGTFTPWGSEYRKWEYGMALRALRENGAQTVLDVGGGSSMFAATAIWAGHEVIVVDPDDYEAMFAQQSARIGKTVSYVKADFFNYSTDYKFDAVICISVIEHVHKDEKFFFKLLEHVNVGGVLVLTTDFSLTGEPFVYPTHLRTYSAEALKHMIKFAKAEGFEVLGAKPNYNKFEPLIYGLYSFASLVLKRVA